MEELNIISKVNNLEKEILSLKLLLLKLSQKKKRGELHLEGSLEGVDITEEDIKDSKTSLFN